MAADKQRGSYIDITCDAPLRDSTIALSNNVTLSNPPGAGGVDGTSITVGNDAVLSILGGNVTGPGNRAVGWSVGNRGVVGLSADLGGIDLNFGTSGAQSPSDATAVSIGSVGVASAGISDGWTLGGYADVFVNRCLHARIEGAPGEGATFLLQDHAQVSVAATCPRGTLPWACGGTTAQLPQEDPQLTAPVIGGTWTVGGNASVNCDGGALRGFWTVKDSGQVYFGGRFAPVGLTVDGTQVTCGRLGRCCDVWDLLLINGAVTTATLTADHPGIGDSTVENSTLTYLGLGNRYIAEGPIRFGGALIKGGWAASLAVDTQKGLVISSKLVTTTGPPIDFDTEGVSLTLASTTFAPALEVFGPDYDGGNVDNVLFTDSPCVRRWQGLTIDTMQTATLENDFASTPISCAGPSCAGAEVPEALYVSKLEVVSGSVLQVNGLNIYYTGKLDNSGTIIDGSDPYTPRKLTPTLYGNFNSTNVVGTDAGDVARFNDGYCSVLGDANYDHLADWNCNGRIDAEDRDQFLLHWPADGIVDECPCVLNGCP